MTAKLIQTFYHEVRVIVPIEELIAKIIDMNGLIECYTFLY